MKVTARTCSFDTSCLRSDVEKTSVSSWMVCKEAEEEDQQLRLLTARTLFLTVFRLGCEDQRIICKDGRRDQNLTIQAAQTVTRKMEAETRKRQLAWLEVSAALVSTGAVATFAGSSDASFIPDFRARMPSPMPLPSSGNFFGPKTSKAIKKITSRCIG